MTRLVSQLREDLQVCPYCIAYYAVPQGVLARIERTCDHIPPARCAAVLCDPKTKRPMEPYTIFHYCEHGVPKEIPT